MFCNLTEGDNDVVLWDIFTHVEERLTFLSNCEHNIDKDIIMQVVLRKDFNDFLIIHFRIIGNFRKNVTSLLYISVKNVPRKK